MEKKVMEDGEIGVFAAEKYFNAMEDQAPTSTGVVRLPKLVVTEEMESNYIRTQSFYSQTSGTSERPLLGVTDRKEVIKERQIQARKWGFFRVLLWRWSCYREKNNDDSSDMSSLRKGSKHVYGEFTSRSKKKEDHCLSLSRAVGEKAGNLVGGFGSPISETLDPPVCALGGRGGADNDSEDDDKWSETSADLFEISSFSTNPNLQVFPRDNRSTVSSDGCARWTVTAKSGIRCSAVTGR